MDRAEMFEAIFGHCAHQSTKIETAVKSLLKEVSPRSESSQAAAIVAQMPYPTFNEKLEAEPSCSALLRRYAASPPRGTIRDAPAHFDELSDAMQEAILALVFQSLVRWQALRRVMDSDICTNAGIAEDPRFSEGATAYACLLGLDCLMAESSQEEAIAKVDAFVVTALNHFIGQPDRPTEPAEPPDADIRHSQFIAAAGPELHQVAEAAWDYEQLVLRGRRYVTLDLEAGMGSFERNAIGETLKQWASALAISSYPERYRLLHKAVIALAADVHEWEALNCDGRRISEEASPSPIWRRCTRVLSMVHELHKAGYQRIRILPFLSGSGCYWRGWITYSDNVMDDGYHLIDWDLENTGELVAKFTSGQDNEFFGWADAKTMNARELAGLFIERFSLIAAKGQGCDWAYAGWLTDVLGYAELGQDSGGLVNLINHDFPMDPTYLARWQPPPPHRRPER